MNPIADNQTHTSFSKEAKIALIVLFVLGMLVTLTRFTRIDRYQTSSDEMLHLQSWRNRYDLNYQHAVGLRRIETSSKLSPGAREALINAYHEYKAVRFLLFIAGDPPSLLFSTSQEILRAIVGNSAIALRVPPVVFGAVFFAAMAVAGWKLGGPGTAVIAAVLTTISPVMDAYTNQGRPHVMAMAALSMVIAAFVRSRQMNGKGWRLTLLAALFAQLSHWGLWLTVAPFVAIELYDLLRRESLAGVRRAWWYVVASVLMLVIFVGYTLPFSSGAPHLGFQGFGRLFDAIGTVGPFGAAFVFRGPLVVDIYTLAPVSIAMVIAGVLTLLVSIIGAAMLPRASYQNRLMFLALAGVLLFFIVSTVILGNARHIMILIPVCILPTAVLVRQVFKRRDLLLTAVGCLLFASGQGLISLQNAQPARWGHVRTTEPNFKQMATYLAGRMSSDDQWTGYQHFFADVLYPYGLLRDPLDSFDRAMFEQNVKAVKVASQGDLFVVTSTDMFFNSQEFSTLDKNTVEFELFEPNHVIIKMPR